jgi:superfamily I DNA/RNA helicase
VPSGGEVATYHQLCDRVLRSHGAVPDFSDRDAFPRLEEDFSTIDPGQAWRFETLIVDEGQDFHAEWRDPLLRLLGAGGSAWWLEDPMQNLYGRPAVPLPGWVVLRCDTNYRSPRDILEHINRIVALDRPVEAGSPLSGSEVDISTYTGTQGLIEATKRALTKAIGRGFKRDMIAVVTFRGREHSALAPYDRLGPHALKAFTGRYDLLGSPIHTEGDTVIDSVYRFKGRSAPCVIFTEIDFEALDELAMRKLFVGATRAMMKLTLIVSERAAKALRERLGPN